MPVPPATPESRIRKYPDCMTDQPIIFIAADERLPQIEAEFRARYDRDYRIVTADDAQHALETLKELVTSGATYAAVLDDLREATIRRDIDTFTGIPMGPRDEEFHTIVTELLSEWGWSVARPAVSIIDVVAEPHDREAGAIRDLLERLGFPNRILTPDSIEGAALVAAASADSPVPIVLPLARAYDGRLRCLRGAQHRRAGTGCDRRAGRVELHDPQLPRVPTRNLGHAPRAALPHPGWSIRRQVLHGPVRDRSGALHARRRAQLPGAPRRHGAACANGLIATGVAYRRLGIESVDEHTGAGV